MGQLGRFWKIHYTILLICVLFGQYERGFGRVILSRSREASEHLIRHIRKPRAKQRTRVLSKLSSRGRALASAGVISSGSRGNPRNKPEPTGTDLSHASLSKVQVKPKTVKEDLEQAKNRLMKLCDDFKKFPYIVCRTSPKDSHKFTMMSGSFGVGVLAHLINNATKYKVEIHANAPVISPLEDPRLTLGTSDATLVQSSLQSVVSVFIKTGRFLRLEKQLKLCPLDAPSMFCLEKRRARALSGLNLSPIIYDVISSRTRTPVIPKEFYIMEYLNGGNLQRVANIIVEDMEAMWKFKVVKLLYIHHDSNERHNNQLLPHLNDISYNTMIRLRSLLQIIISAFTVAKRLWLENMRHCDLHNGNIIILRKTVGIHTPEFDALVTEGKAVSLDLHGHSLYDIHSLKQTLSQLGPQKLLFYILDPQYTRLIDLSYLIRVDLLAQSAEGKGNLWTPCRRFSHHRNEDIVELARVVRMVSKQAQKLADVYKRLWQNEEDLQHVEANVYANVNAVLAPQITRLLSVVRSASHRILQSRGPWKDCIVNQEMYVKALKRTTQENWRSIREDFHLKSDVPKCSVTTEEEALQHGITIVEQLLKRLNNVHGKLSSVTSRRQRQ